MDALNHHLDELDPELARQVRESATRAGLRFQDPAARMIAEMWVVVSAMKKERRLLDRELANMGRQLQDNRRYLLILIALGAVNMLGIIAMLLT